MGQLGGYTGPWAPLALHRTLIRWVACGADHSLAGADGQQIYGCGRSKDGQLPGITGTNSVATWTLLRVSADYAACGADHTVLLCDGEVRAFGRGAEGQLGPTAPDPTGLGAVVLVPPARAVAAGADHSVALSVEGAVYIW